MFNDRDWINQLDKIRMDKFISWQEVANEIGITYATLWRLKSDESKTPSLRTKRLICKYIIEQEGKTK